MGENDLTEFNEEFVKSFEIIDVNNIVDIHVRVYLKFLKKYPNATFQKKAGTLSLLLDILSTAGNQLGITSVKFFKRGKEENIISETTFKEYWKKIKELNIVEELGDKVVRISNIGIKLNNCLNYIFPNNNKKTMVLLHDASKFKGLNREQIYDYRNTPAEKDNSANNFALSAPSVVGLNDSTITPVMSGQIMLPQAAQKELHECEEKNLNRLQKIKKKYNIESITIRSSI